MGSSERHASLASSKRWREVDRGDATKIWSHIQVVMSGNRIICAPLELPLGGDE
jgi:hypothetical protein